MNICMPQTDGLSIPKSLVPAIESKQMEASSNSGVNVNPPLTNFKKASNSSQEDIVRRGIYSSSRGIWFDLNAAPTNTSPSYFENHCPQKNYNDKSNLVEMSECGSTTGSFEEEDHTSVWKEMKQNSFISNSYNRKPPMVPKRGRKTKSEILQKKLEMAKRERVDRFAKIAAPSGLFKELNPGIINHVRNSKQVHSIIEALVKSESGEAGNARNKPASKLKIFDNGKMKDSPCQIHGDLVSLERDSMNVHARGCSIANLPVPLGITEECFDSCSSRVDIKMQNISSPFVCSRNDDILPSNVFSSLPTKGCSESIASMSSDDNVTSVSVLTVKAATVASQWLDLLHQDAKGRLAALRRSRKRARSVIQTDLPSLFTEEFTSTITDDTSISVCKFPKNDVDKVHQTRWTSLFSQMDMALSEEEKQLEGWISQVTEMQSRCKKGLLDEPWNSQFFPQKLRTKGDSWRAETASNDKDLAVTAAAASIYSTCSFLLNKDQGDSQCAPGLTNL